MKLSFRKDLSNVSTVQDLAKHVSTALDKVSATLNGNVDLLDNGSNDHIDFTFTAPNVDVGVAHSLGKVPRGYTQTSSSNHALSLQNGSTANTATTLYLQAGSTGTVTVLVF